MKGCELLYPFYLFTSTAKAIVKLSFTLTLDTHPSCRAMYNIALDGKDNKAYELVQPPKKSGELPPGWLESVMDCVWVKTHELTLGDVGAHNLSIALCDENIALEKVVIDLGGVRNSYLGPPESSYATGRYKH